MIILAIDIGVRNVRGYQDRVWPGHDIESRVRTHCTMEIMDTPNGDFFMITIADRRAVIFYQLRVTACIYCGFTFLSLSLALSLCFGV